MLERTVERFGLKPQHLAADSAYGSAENLAWLVKEKQIAPHIPVIDKADRTDGTFSRSDFVFDPEQDHYTCPGGKQRRRAKRELREDKAERLDKHLDWLGSTRLRRRFERGASGMPVRIDHGSANRAAAQ